MEDKSYTIALLIDTENVSAKYLTYLMKELIALGRVTIKRMYGDFTSSPKSGWKDIVNQFSVIPVQQYSYTTGKNVTDSKMIIDAMDILYSGNVDAFCIMSSDSDFTGLARRLRESDMFVIGAGESKTPGSFINACDRFFKLDSIYTQAQSKGEALKKAKTQPKKKLQEDKAVTLSTSKGTPVPAVRDEEESKGRDNYFIPKEEIIDFVSTLFESGNKTEIPLSVIMQKIFQAYPDFNPKEYGASKASKFFDGTPFKQKKGKSTEVLICLSDE